jgi:hypothetical protein
MIGFELDALSGLQAYFQNAPDVARRAASLAMNQSANRYGLQKSRELMQKAVNFPPGYLSPAGDRLGVSQPSTADNLEVIISGRDRPTSLLRFSRFGAKTVGASVTVRPGSTKLIKRAFLINLRNGNQGLAIRLRKGEELHNYLGTTKRLGSTGLVLLYGPSVDQVFSYVSEQVGPGLLEATSAEFFRQYVRLGG